MTKGEHGSDALYQGTTSVGPQNMEKELGFSPWAKFRPTPTPTEHAKGAPACPGVPWGLAFETWDPPSKGQSNPALRFDRITSTTTTEPNPPQGP
jgi:hypothetical protein